MYSGRPGDSCIVDSADSVTRIVKLRPRLVFYLLIKWHLSKQHTLCFVSYVFICLFHFTQYNLFAHFSCFLDSISVHLQRIKIAKKKNTFCHFSLTSNPPKIKSVKTKNPFRFVWPKVAITYKIRHPREINTIMLEVLPKPTRTGTCKPYHQTPVSQ